jgi:Zn-dependent peptidase ImmA (M78 family)/DNA-binding XRE family transcriptional regulator
MKQIDTFNRHMMAVARDSRGWTQSALAEQMGIAQGTISKIEAGLMAAPAEFIEKLASTLRYELALFFETGRAYGMPPFHYRRRKKLGQKPLDKMIAEMNIRRIQLSILLKSAKPQSNKFIPEVDRDEYQGINGRKFNVEDIARQLRELWLIPDGPIENVTELIEDHGGIVIPCNFDSDLIDAVSQRIDGLPVLFFVNMNAPSDRIRHTLCHELGHMVLHTTTFLDDDAMEQEADHFAGAFLLPARAVGAQLSRFDFRQVVNMKKYWKSSMSAIVMRADRLNMITPYQKKMFFIQMNKLGYRKSEPYEPPKEYPSKIRKLIEYHINVLGYSKRDLAKTLYLNETEFEKMYGSPMVGHNPEDDNFKPKLRIVK